MSDARLRVLHALFVLALAGCEGRPSRALREAEGAAQVTPRALPSRYARAELLDPASCRPCHAAHYEEWASSMHAYASVDPVFVAMNRRGQRETGGALGKFCVQCHAPMALREGLTTDGLNLVDLPKWARGVTCYFCHNAVAYGTDHFNASVTLANDLTMRGSYGDAIDPGVHGVARGSLHDRNTMDSSVFCGTCHDVVNGHGVHIERTLKEYEASVFSIERSGLQGGDSCQGCHMPAKRDADYIASMPGVALQKRAIHAHRFPAVDVALTDDFPGQDAQRRATECALADAVRVARIEELRPGEFSVALETDAGHQMPSGAAHDRRLWVEFVAYDAAGQVIYQSGKIADGEIEEVPAGSAGYDPALCMLRDHLIDRDGHETHMFWEAARPSASRLLPPLTRLGASHVITCEGYRIPGRRTPARVEVRLKLRPLGADVVRSLIDSGDLDPAIASRVPTFTLHGAAVEWRRDVAGLRRLAPRWTRENCLD